MAGDAARVRRGRRALFLAAAGAAAAAVGWSLTRPAAAVPAGPGAARARGFLRAGVPLWLPPFGAPSRGGAWIGLDVALAQHIAAIAMGNPARLRLLPLLPPERVWALRQGMVDIVAAAYAGPVGHPPAEVAAEGASAVGPYFVDRLELLVRRSAPVASPAELDGGVVGTLQGGGAADALRAALRGQASVAMQTFESAAVAAQAVAGGRVRALVAGGAVARALATFDPELAPVRLDGMGEEGYWLLLPAGDPTWQQPARRAISELPTGRDLEVQLQRWNEAAAAPWTSGNLAGTRPANRPLGRG